MLVLVGMVCFAATHAQGGGPPMLTDDPGTVDPHKWEINTSVNTAFTNDVQVALPYVDANYGAAQGFQLKIEAPLTFSFGKNVHLPPKLGAPLIGVKYRFLNEDSSFLSISTYPQVAVTGKQKEALVPLLFAKTVGKFVFGEEIGYLLVEKDSNNMIEGSLVSYQLTKRLEIIGEYFMQRSYSSTKGTTGLLNFGFRYGINNTFTLIGSAGTQLVEPANTPRQVFYSFLGVQSSF